MKSIVRNLAILVVYVIFTSFIINTLSFVRVQVEITETNQEKPREQLTLVGESHPF